MLTDISAFYGTLSGQILLTDADAAAGELYNLMSTMSGDEMFEPTLGSNLPLRVFAPINARLIQLVNQDVFIAASTWLKHLSVIPAQSVIYAAGDNRFLGISVAYLYNGNGWAQDVYLAQVGNN